MKTKSKSASIVRFAGGLLLLALAACDSMGYQPPHVFSGNEVPPEVMSEPRVVPVPQPETMANLGWLRLGDVPSKPTNFTPQPVLAQTFRQMENDRTEARMLKAQVDNPAPTMAPPPIAEP